MKQSKFKQSHNLNWYTILWGISILVAGYLLFNWQFEKNYLGIVERKTHQIGAQESGRVNQVLVDIGDYVKINQVLAILDMTDLKTNLGQLKEELFAIKNFEKAHQTRFSIEVQRMGLQLENEASSLMDRLSLIESQSTKLAGLNTEIERLKSAKEAGLGQNRDLANLILERDALASLLKEQSKDLASQSQKLEQARKMRKELASASIDSLTKSLYLDQMEYAEEIKRQIADIEHRMNLRTIISPSEGYVTDIFSRTGDVVPAFAPIISVEEARPRFLTMYIPEKSNVPLERGMQVDIGSSRNSDYDTYGYISFVHPGFVQANERISFRGQLFWARKVRVELPEAHHLVPGEVVNTRIKSREVNENYLVLTSAASADDTSDSKHTSGDSFIKKMNVPESIWRTSRFEPSGITWVPELKKFIIVSDDTGIKDTDSDHASYIFLMDENGNVDADPVIISGIETINDVEAITRQGSDVFFLTSSQNISKKGKRPGNREFLIKLKWTGTRFFVERKIQLLSLIEKSYSKEEIRDLGLYDLEKDGRPVLNIEGGAFFDGSLYFGLKQPVSARGAIIWRLQNLESIFNGESLKPGQLSVFGHVDLGANKNKKSSISDMVFDSNGVLWLTSTIANVDDDIQLGGFHRITQFADGSLEAKRILSFPGLKPEGVCLHESKQFVIVFDMANENPFYCYVDTEGAL